MSSASRFWRDPALPFVEARRVDDGRKVCYSPHSHQSFSIGAITAGRSTYVSGQSHRQVSSGTVVMMNPGVVHTCNPIHGEPWSYLMLYVDLSWLQALGFQPFEAIRSDSPIVYRALCQLFEVLLDDQGSTPGKDAALRIFFGELIQRFGSSPAGRGQGNPRLLAAAAFIREHCTQPLRLEDIGAAAGLSTSYLIRAFKQQFGLTPHAYLLDQRVQYARAQLRRGRLIAEVALEAGFADQAHLQRAFKRLLAATPGHYRSAH
ncbi:AraC family transcriptional regulator [Pseudomonas sp. GD03860]|uniref:AraC family transcriptional regulator n=1 Tax=Pseudomonas TaxID=286 RepID=UPI00236450D5|nr:MULTISPECIES: AraC family transcriptional regulator [Pseudomonas]MDD2058016.1 AraC family transcriptional regulator [Pseudomonas putida]MDH0639473.1 AraC family transcriptional regulator [Pseudomonas sp. GD03860]